MMKKSGDLALTASLVSMLAIFAVIAAVANHVIQDARLALLDSVRERTASFARTSREALAPQVDRFWLNFLVNEFARDRITRYALVTDPAGRILSHSIPEKIGELDATGEGLAARRAEAPLLQTFRGADGLDYYYFSAPITLGGRRLGTAAAALNTATISAALAATRQKLLIILGAALLALVLLAGILVLVRKQQRAARLKSDMVHTVSHEFNNALTAIDACIFLLEESEPPGRDESRARTYEILADARKSLRLYVKNILNEARMESGKFRIEKKPLNLLDLVGETMTAMEELIRQKDLAVAVDLPKNCRLLVSADHEAMALVTANLIGNAVKYTPAKGRLGVKISVRAGDPAEAVFRVEDSGPGISADDLEMIASGFYRTYEGRAAAGGFGLGLKISSEMLLLHGSRLEVRSEPGKGSSFSFSLPVLETNCELPAK